jgi:hypothetical protein
MQIRMQIQIDVMPLNFEISANIADRIKGEL